MTEAELILIAQDRCDTVEDAVSLLLLAVFGRELKFVLAIGAPEDPNTTGCIVANVKSQEEAESILHTALYRDKSDNALDLGENQTKQ